MFILSPAFYYSFRPWMRGNKNTNRSFSSLRMCELFCIISEYNILCYQTADSLWETSVHNPGTQPTASYPQQACSP